MSKRSIKRLVPIIVLIVVAIIAIGHYDQKTTAASGVPATATTVKPTTWAISPSPAGANAAAVPAVSQAAADAFNKDPWVAKLSGIGVQFVTADDSKTVLGIETPPAAGACHLDYRTIVDLNPKKNGRKITAAMPPKSCAPGAIDVPRMANALLAKKRCVNTAGYRPSSYQTNKYKVIMFAAEEPRVTADSSLVELDHNAPLELCGATAARNLWNEPPTSADQVGTLNGKDYVENHLATLVEHGNISVSQASYLLLNDWTTALVGLP